MLSVPERAFLNPKLKRSGVMTKKLSHCFDFLMHTTKVNKLWHKCSKGTT